MHISDFNFKGQTTNVTYIHTNMHDFHINMHETQPNSHTYELVFTQKKSHISAYIMHSYA